MRNTNTYTLLKFVLWLAAGCAALQIQAQAEVQNPNFPFWKIKGNAGTDTALHFAGTTDATDYTLRTNNVRRVTLDVNGRLGIGTVQPLRLLHLFGDNTARMGGLATGGTFISAPAAATDKLLYADANGDIKAIAGGTAGQTLTLGAGGIPAWVTPATASNDWTITGNSGTVDGTNFIGTTDNVPLNLRINNQNAGRITNNGITFIGYQAGNVNVGANNTAVGYQALLRNTTGFENVAAGKDALYNNITGEANVAIGTQALLNNTAGGSNTAVGYDALRSNTASFNVAVGRDALRANTTGDRNTAIGYWAMRNSTGGIYNAAVGSNALLNNTGNDNSALGKDALLSNTSGGQNTALGKDAMLTNTTGNSNIAVGYQALASNTTGGENVALARDALRQNTTGVQNTATGKDALRNNTTGGGNTATGRAALFTNIASNYNTATGFQSLFFATGAENSGTGSNALYNTSTGAQNTAMGGSAGFSNTTGSLNTFLGYNANPATGTLTNATAVGANASVSASNCLVLGSGVNVGIGATAPGQRLTVVDAGNINQYSGTLSVFANNLTQGVGIGYMGIQALGSNANQDLSFNARGAGHITMQVTGTTGNVGIGVTNPGNLLSISGPADQFLINNPTNDGTIGVTLNENNSNAARIHHEGDFASGYLEIEDYSAGWSTTALVVKQGNVGIGTNTPTYPLQVSGSQSGSFTFGYLNGSGATGLGSGAANYSIYASDRIAATEFNAYSDARIKNITGLSNSAHDLETLSQIQITDYRFIDTIGKGTKEFKKVIAQQIEQVYPQAVATITDVVPDIYKAASIHNGYIAVENKLKAGDVVKLILDRGIELAPVLSATSKGFTVALKDEGRVFVYGTQVTDFRTVDYEAIAMLNVSATQQLFRLLTELQQKNEEYKNKIDYLVKDIEVMKTALCSRP